MMLSNRIYPTTTSTSLVKKNLAYIYNNAHNYINDNAAARTIILQQPKLEGEIIKKGVMLITFTTTLPYFYHHIDINKLFKYYYIVLEPSWAGYCDPQILFFAQYRQPVIVQATEKLDRDFLYAIDTNLIPVDFGASDWVDYRIFKPIKNTTKKYDSIYVANYNSIKRLEIYLRALKSIHNSSADYKAAIICASWGDYRDYYRYLVKKYKLENMLDVYEDIDKNQLNTILNQSKVNILLSLKEGSNRSLFESMFAGTPVIALQNNIGINKDYINSQTGKLILDRELVATLLDFSKNYHQYDPLTWAMQNISPEASTAKLIQALSLKTDLPPDNFRLAIKTNNPEVNYFHKAPYDKITLNQQILSFFENTNSSSNKDFFSFLSEMDLPIF